MQARSWRDTHRPCCDGAPLELEPDAAADGRSPIAVFEIGSSDGDSAERIELFATADRQGPGYYVRSRKTRGLARVPRSAGERLADAVDELWR